MVLRCSPQGAEVTSFPSGDGLLPSPLFVLQHRRTDTLISLWFMLQPPWAFWQFLRLLASVALGPGGCSSPNVRCGTSGSLPSRPSPVTDDIEMRPFDSSSLLVRCDPPLPCRQATLRKFCPFTSVHMGCRSSGGSPSAPTGPAYPASVAAFPGTENVDSVPRSVCISWGREADTHTMS